MRGELYLDERQQRKHRRILKLKIYGGLILFFILIIGAGYLIIYSSLFQIKNLTLSNADLTQGNMSINKDEFIDNLKDFFVNHSKIRQFLKADNILIWNNKIESFLENYPQIAQLTIEKDYFNRQVNIEIKEREKFGIWCELTNNQQLITDNLITNNCYWFDKNGIFFAEAPMVEGTLINKIEDFSNRSLKLGDEVLKEKFLTNLLKILEVLEKADFKIKTLILKNVEFQEIIAEPLFLEMPKIYFSLRIAPHFALPAINSLKNIGLEKIEYIDLRVENRAYYKVKP